VFGTTHAGEIGAAGAVTLEGTRPLLLEIQALVSRTDLSMPRRVGTGVDPKRLAMIVAVLARHAGVLLGTADVFVNVAGGVRVDEPGEVGAAVACTLEGTRPLLLEVQALVAPTDLAMPRRVGTGVDPRRLAMIVAVLARHGRLPLGGADVFVNVAGGVRIDEPGADLGIALAIASAARSVPVRERLGAFGEIGLTGRLRPAAQGPRRAEECRKLGLEPFEAETLDRALKLGLAAARARTDP
jgi:predicted ATP-dependent serine protease